MEGLAPPLRLVLDLERALESGTSVRSAGYQWAHRESSALHVQLRQLLAAFDEGQSPDQIFLALSSPQRRAVFDLIWRGLRGNPILSSLRALRGELEAAAELELDDFMAKLPMRALVPLLLLIFPGFLVLLFGPLIEVMKKGVL